MKLIKSFELLLEIINEEWNHIGITFAEPWKMPWVVPAGEREDYEIHLVEKGSGKLRIGSREYSVKQGDLIWFNSAEGNSFTPEEEPFRFVFVTFKFKNRIENANIEILDSVLKEEVFPVVLGDVPEIQQIFHRMHKEIFVKSRKSDFKLKLLLGTLVMKIIECGKQNFNNEHTPYTVSENARDLVDRVIFFLQRNYGKNISLKEMAGMVNLHPRYLCTVFKQVTGQTITEFLRGIRIEKAKRLLLYTVLSITEIALETGFGSSQYFSRVFNRAEGMDPRTFRKTRRSQSE